MVWEGGQTVARETQSTILVYRFLFFGEGFESWIILSGVEMKMTLELRFATFDFNCSRWV